MDTAYILQWTIPILRTSTCRVNKRGNWIEPVHWSTSLLHTVDTCCWSFALFQMKIFPMHMYLCIWSYFPLRKRIDPPNTGGTPPLQQCHLPLHQPIYRHRSLCTPSPHPQKKLCPPRKGHTDETVHWTIFQPHNWCRQHRQKIFDPPEKKMRQNRI